VCKPQKRGIHSVANSRMNRSPNDVGAIRARADVPVSGPSRLLELIYVTAQYLSFKSNELIRDTHRWRALACDHIAADYVGPGQTDGCCST
jgi:hypothetical protein